VNNESEPKRLPSDETHDNHGNNGEDALIEQQHKDALREQERMRKWIEDDEPLPVKISCKLRQHLVPKDKQ
jgi:hypothetical protein